ncbi:MAG: PIN domain-containing protein [Muribaculaceae bacterium]|nr:PIN domain-containing protein [Muribaculaceae bacterium]
MIITVKQETTYLDLWNLIPPDIPVLFWDTCGLLDCLRIVTRFNKSHMDNYSFVAERIIAGEVVSVITDMVRQELLDNYDDVCNEASREQNKAIEGAIRLMELLGLPEPDMLTVKTTLSVANVVDRSKNIFHDILRNSYLITDDNLFRDFAHMRIMAKMPPAHIKQEYKDCHIWGCVTNCASIRPDKNRKVFYLTSNTTDYSAEGSKGQVADLIKQDCDSTKIDFSFNIGALRAGLSTI